LKLFKEEEDENISVDSIKTSSATSSSKKKITKSKFLGKAKASGLRKRKNSSFQSSIKTFFDKVWFTSGFQSEISSSHIKVTSLTSCIQ